MSFFLNLLELESLKIKINDNKFVAFIRVAANILSSIYPYTLSDTLLIYKKKSELEINSLYKLRVLTRKIIGKNLKSRKLIKIFHCQILQ